MGAPETPVDLTSELVDELLESSRLEIERELAQAGPNAVRTLADVMQHAERDSDRISAASKILDKVMAPPKAETPEHRGPIINVVINKLYAGERRALPISVSDEVMDAIEAGATPVVGEDWDGHV